MKIYKLNDIQKERIHLARQELKNGKTISYTELQKEVIQWLNLKNIGSRIK